MNNLEHPEIKKGAVFVRNYRKYVDDIDAPDKDYLFVTEYDEKHGFIRYTEVSFRTCIVPTVEPSYSYDINDALADYKPCDESWEDILNHAMTVYRNEFNLVTKGTF